MQNTNFCFCLKTKMQTHAQTQIYMNRGGKEKSREEIFLVRDMFMYNLKNCQLLGLNDMKFTQIPFM